MPLRQALKYHGPLATIGLLELINWLSRPTALVLLTSNFTYSVASMLNSSAYPKRPQTPFPSLKTRSHPNPTHRALLDHYNLPLTQLASHYLPSLVPTAILPKRMKNHVIWEDKVCKPRSTISRRSYKQEEYGKTSLVTRTLRKRRARW